MKKYVEIGEIPVDYDPNKVCGVMNPTNEDFTVKFGGKEFTIKAGAKELRPEPLANHIAKHLSQKICLGDMLEFLKEQFPDLDKHGREEWIFQPNLKLGRDDFDRVKELLLFKQEEIEHKNVEEPVSKFKEMSTRKKKKGELKK